MSDLDSRLEAAAARRQEIAAQVQRLSGRLDAAKVNLAAVEAECLDRGIPPEHLDEAIAKLEARAQALVKELEDGLRAAEEALAPYLMETP